MSHLFYHTKGCIRPRALYNEKLSTLASGTGYAAKFKRLADEYSQQCSERPLDIRAKKAWVNHNIDFRQSMFKSIYLPFYTTIKQSQPETFAEFNKITTCHEGNKKGWKNLVEIVHTYKPRRAKKINRLYAKIVDGVDNLCNSFASPKNFSSKAGRLWQKRIDPFYVYVKKILKPLEFTS